MSKREIERKFDEIVAFSEVEKFIDTPVKHYSSGMYVRLAFAVAAHLEPKILIVDEVLAVGDAAFQKKCLGKMGDVAKEGRTVLFVSHQMQAITHFCNRCLLLNAGQLVSMGETVSIVNQYLSTGYTGEMSDLGSHTKRSGDGRLRFIESWIEDDTGNRIVIAQSGQTIKIVLRYKQMTPEPIKNLQVAIGLSTLGNVRVSELCNSFSGYFFDETIPYEGKIECILPKLPLNSGRYTYNIIAEKANGVIFDYIMDAGVLEVEAGDFFGTGRISSDNTRLILMEQEWSVSGEFESKGVIYDH
jgi:lipopolysaccharide transport system ATP-binding protein